MGADIAAIRVADTWWRQLPAGLEPQLRPERLPDARWQRGTVVDALYFADSPETAWAEWYRWLADSGLEPRAGLPRDLWRVEIVIDEVVDLRDEGALKAVGLPRPRPDRGQWPAFQAVGEGLFAEGRPAIVAPSAARAGGSVLCVPWPARSGTRVRHRSRETFVEPPVPRGLRT